MRVSAPIAERCLRALQWILTLCAVWVIAQIVFLRGPLPQPNLARADVQVPDVADADTSPRDLNQLAALWQRDLRQTLIEPKPKPKPTPKPPPPPPPPRLPRLLATFVERGDAWGLFVDERGAHRVKRAGSMIDQMEIESIRRGSARLRKGQRAFEISVPEPKRR